MLLCWKPVNTTKNDIPQRFDAGITTEHGLNLPPIRREMQHSAFAHPEQQLFGMQRQPFTAVINELRKTRWNGADAKEAAHQFCRRGTIQPRKQEAPPGHGDKAAYFGPCLGFKWPTTGYGQKARGPAQQRRNDLC